MMGIIIGISIAFPVLILATGNIFGGFLATAIIVCVTVSVLGVLPLNGWKVDVRSYFLAFLHVRGSVRCG